MVSLGFCRNANTVILHWFWKPDDGPCEEFYSLQLIVSPRVKFVCFARCMLVFLDSLMYY